MYGKWGISKVYHEVLSEFAIKHFYEVDGDSRLNLMEENLKVQFFLSVINYTVIFQVSNRFHAF